MRIYSVLLGFALIGCNNEGKDEKSIGTNPKTPPKKNKSSSGNNGGPDEDGSHQGTQNTGGGGGGGGGGSNSGSDSGGGGSSSGSDSGGGGSSSGSDSGGGGSSSGSPGGGGGSSSSSAGGGGGSSSQKGTPNNGSATGGETKNSGSSGGSQDAGKKHPQNGQSNALNPDPDGDQGVNAPKSGIADQQPRQDPVPENRIVEPKTPLGLGHFDSRDFSHIVVIPDVHGDAEHFIYSLWIAFQKVEPSGYQFSFPTFNGKVRQVAESVEFPSGRPRYKPDSKLSRLGERVAIVQLGDIMDRGPQSLFSYKILASIETAIGWKLIQLFGNHELMIYNPNNPDVFNLSYNKIPTDISDADARRLFGPGGGLRDYLLNHDLVMARIGTPPRTDGKGYVIDQRSPDTLFVHAGLDMDWIGPYLRSIGQRKFDYKFIDLINTYQRTKFLEDHTESGRFGNDDTGPLWTRAIPDASGKAGKEDELFRLCARLNGVLTSLQVSRIIVGHTPDSENHTTRRFCDSTLIITDVAMSKQMSNRRDGQPYAMVMKIDDNGSRLGSMIGHYDRPGHHERRDDILVAR